MLEGYIYKCPFCRNRVEPGRGVVALAKTEHSFGIMACAECRPDIRTNESGAFLGSGERVIRGRNSFLND